MIKHLGIGILQWPIGMVIRMHLPLVCRICAISTASMDTPTLRCLRIIQSMLRFAPIADLPLLDPYPLDDFHDGQVLVRVCVSQPNLVGAMVFFTRAAQYTGRPQYPQWHPFDARISPPCQIALHDGYPGVSALASSVLRC